MKKVFLLVIMVLASFLSEANTPTNVAGSVSLSRHGSSLVFTENKGQVTDQNHHLRTDIQFSVKAAPGLNIFIGNGAIHYQFSKNKGSSAGSFMPLKHLHKNSVQMPDTAIPLTFSMYRMDVELLNANQHAEILMEDKQAYYENYYNENTGENGATAHTYNRITYKNIYPFIDWVLYTKNGQLEHEFMVHEGGDARNIRLKYGGAINLKINEDGSLTVTTPQGVITEKAPKSFLANGEAVKSNFKLDGDILSYETDGYTGTFIIDPALQWGTFFGSNNGTDAGGAVETDDSLNVYLAGVTNSTANIATIGAYQATLSSPYYLSAFLAKFDSLGHLLWSTYYSDIVGSFGTANGLTVDKSGSVYMVGTIEFGGGSLLATPGAHQGNYSGGEDAFIAKFNNSGLRIWGSYFGGPGNDQPERITSDDSGNIYFSGYTNSNTGIASPGAYQITLAGGNDAFLTKFSGTGQFKWATYYGGSNDERDVRVVTDTLFNVYLSGTTSSTSGIATVGSYQPTNAGEYDLFLVKFDSSGTRQWATYFGGDSAEDNGGMAIDVFQNLYIFGTTTGSIGLASPGAYKSTFTGKVDPILVKFSSSGIKGWSTYYSGSSIADDNNWGNVATDRRGNVYIIGTAFSDSSLSTSGTYETIYTGLNATYVGGFDSTGTRFWGTYFGNFTFGDNIATDKNNNVYITGETRDSCGVATPGAYQTIGDPINGDAFLAKFSPNGQTVEPINGLSSVCTNTPIRFHDNTLRGFWGSSNTNVATVDASGLVTGLARGTDTISYTVNNNCAVSSVIFPIVVKESPATPTVSMRGITTFCLGDSVILETSGGYKYLWSNTDTTQSITVKSAGSYAVVVTDTNNCSAMSSATTVTVNLPETVRLNHLICRGDSFSFNSQNLTQAGTYNDTLQNISGCDSIITLNLVVDSLITPTIARNNDTLQTQSFTTYQWLLNGFAITGDTSQNITALQDGAYSVIVTNTNGCGDTSAALNFIGLGITNITNGLKFYPNPGTGNFTLKFSDDEVREIEITDEIGETVLAPAKVKGERQFNLEALSAGIYFLLIKQNNQEVCLKFSVTR